MTVTPICNAISKITWGILLDYVSFKKLYMLSITIGIITSASFKYIIPDNEAENITYLIYAILTSIVHAGFISLNPPMISHIFGIT